MKKILKRYILRADFARICGVSAKTITVDVQSGKIPVVPGDGKREYIDLLDSRIEEYRGFKQAKYTIEPGIKKAPPKYKKKVPRAPKITAEPSQQTDVQILDRPEESPERSVDPMSGSFGTDDSHEIIISPMTANIIKTYESIRQTRVKTAKEQGQLVNRDEVIRLFGKLYTIDANQWKTLPASASSEIASAFGIDDEAKKIRVEKLLHEKVHNILKHTQRLMIQYAEEVEGDTEIFKLDGA